MFESTGKILLKVISINDSLNYSAHYPFLNLKIRELGLLNKIRYYKQKENISISYFYTKLERLYEYYCKKVFTKLINLLFIINAYTLMKINLDKILTSNTNIVVN